MCKVGSRTSGQIVSFTQERNILPELHVVTQSFRGRSLIFVEKNVLMMTTVEASLVSVHPACGVFLLQEISFK